ncbi:MAG: hypothetical protein V3U84_07020 [Thiotrichaceae bacterium]
MTTYQCDVCGKSVERDSGSLYPLYSLAKQYVTDDRKEVCLSCMNAVNDYIGKLRDEHFQERVNKVEKWFDKRSEAKREA